MTDKMRFAGLVLAVLLLLSLAWVPAHGPRAVADNEGSTPDYPIDLSGSMSGTLAPGEYTWYRLYRSSRGGPGGIAMHYSPAVPGSAAGVGFYIGYFKEGVFDLEWTTIGDATPLTNEPGVKYWRGDVDAGRPYLFMVRNLSQVTVDYVVGFTGDVFPPPALTFDPNHKQPSYGGWPAPAAAPTPARPQGGGASAAEAVAMDGDLATGSLPARTQSWIRFRSLGGGRDTSVRLKFQPYYETETNQTLFKVWRYQPTASGYVLTELGRGTRGANPPNVKTWRGGGDREADLYLEIINGTPGDVRWEIKLDDFFPYWR